MGHLPASDCWELRKSHEQDVFLFIKFLHSTKVHKTFAIGDYELKKEPFLGQPLYVIELTLVFTPFLNFLVFP